MSTIPDRLPQLVVRLKEHTIRLRLAEGVTSVGSDPGCDLSLNGEGIAPRHCILQPDEEGHGYELFDLLSSAGTRVNGQFAEAARLCHGDQIQIGDVTMTFLEDRQTVRDSGPGEAPVPVADALPFADDPWDAWRDRPAFELPREPLARSAPSEAEPPTVSSSFSLLERFRRARESRAARAVEREALRSARRLEQETKRALAASESMRREAAETLANELAWAERFELGRRNLHPSTFREVLIQQLRSAPFLLVSLALHVLLAIILHLMSVPLRSHEEIAPVSTGIMPLEPPALEETFEDDRPVEEPTETDLPPEEIVAPEPGTPDHPGDESESEEPIEDPEDDTRDFRPGDALVGLDGNLGLKMGGDRGLKLGGTQFRKYVQSLRERGYEVVVVIDSTGSMGGVLSETRKEIDRILMTLGTLIPTFRLGVVTYRDHNEDYLTRGAPLTNQWYKAVAFLDEIVAGGGGDAPEAVLDGLRHAIKDMPWSAGSKRVVILVGDAPPHDRDQKDINSLLRTFAKAGGTVHAVTTGHGSRQLANLTHKAFSEMAALTSGTALTLDRSEELAAILLSLAFGNEHKRDVASAMSSLESSSERVRAARLANLGSKTEIALGLAKTRTDQMLLRELARAARPEHVEAYLATLEDAQVPLSTRWAVTVLLRRALHELGTPGSLVALAMSLNPDHSVERTQPLVDQLSAEWARSRGRSPRNR